MPGVAFGKRRHPDRRGDSNVLRVVSRGLASTCVALLMVGCTPAASPPPERGPNTAESNSRVTYPVAEQEQAIGKDWVLRLPGKFNQRAEDGSLIFWRHGMTIYTVVWNNDRQETQASQLAWLKQRVSPEAFGVEEAADGKILRFAYRLREKRKEGLVQAFYGYAIAPQSYVQMAIYFDQESQLESARNIWQTLNVHAAAE